METEVMETVMTEVLGELREIKQQQKDQTKALVVLMDKVQGLEHKISDIKVPEAVVDTTSIAVNVADGIKEIKSTIEAQPKSVIKQVRVLPFPEYNAGQYYKLVFGKVLFWMMVFVSITYLFILGKRFIDDWSIVNQNQSKPDKYKKAWQYLYRYENKNGKRMMDSVWYRSSLFIQRLKFTLMLKRIPSGSKPKR